MCELCTFLQIWSHMHIFTVPLDLQYMYIYVHVYIADFTFLRGSYVATHASTLHAIMH